MNLELQQLAATLQLEFRGDPGIEIAGVASPRQAAAGDLCFVQERKYLHDVLTGDCSAVILTPELVAEIDDRAVLISGDPQASFVDAIAALELQAPAGEGGIHPSAQIAQTAQIGDAVHIGAQAVIGEKTVIGARSTIGAGCVIGDAVRIGDDCLLHARVTLTRGIDIGDRCILHSGAVIGSDGFGLFMREDRWHKIPQLGAVRIGNDVEIGANTVIDRGALDDTIIEDGCKLDNLIQVAHNVRIGAHTAIAACVGIAGSAVIGRYCKISGGAGILGHLTIVDHVTVTAMSLVTRDIREPGVYSSGTPLMENGPWRRNSARYKSLDELARRIDALEKSRD